MRKCAVTLIEVMISMSLLVVLLGGLFVSYRHLTQRKNELEKHLAPLVEERALYQRLAQIITKAETPLFTDGGLVFRFDRGLYQTPALSNRVLGKLYHDERLRTLSLAVWPDPESDHEMISETFLLLDNVDTVQFHFYSPPEPFQKIVDPEKVGDLKPHEGWHQGVWLYKEMPALIKIVITRDDVSQEMCFDLGHPIRYSAEESA